LSSVGPDYHVSGTQMAWITGTGSGLLGGLGSLIGGWICDRADPWTVYAVFGLFVSVCALWLSVGSPTLFTFATGFLAYALAVGMANGAYVALMLQVLGIRKRGASTGYALMSSAGNVPTSYMTWLDGMGYRHGGARGLMATDAILGGLAGLILLAVARSFEKRPPASKAASATASS